MKTSYIKFGILILILAGMSWACAPSADQQADETSVHQEVTENQEVGELQEIAESQEPAGNQEAGENHEGGQDSDAEIPGSEREIVSELFVRDILIQSFIESNKLTKIHVPAFEAKALAESLVEMKRSDTQSSSLEKLSAASKKIGASAILLDKYGDAEDAPKTRSVYKTFASALMEIKTLYPKVTPTHYWTCSMHPMIWKARSGSCPKCIMELKEIGA